MFAVGVRLSGSGSGREGEDAIAPGLVGGGDGAG